MVSNNPTPHNTKSPRVRHPALRDTVDRRVLVAFTSPSTVEQALEYLTRHYTGAVETDTWRGAIRGLIDRAVLIAVAKGDHGAVTYAVDASALGRQDPRESNAMTRLHTAELEESAAAVRSAHEAWKQTCLKPGAYVSVLDAYRTLGRAVDRHNGRVAALARRQGIEIAHIPTERLR